APRAHQRRAAPPRSRRAAGRAECRGGAASLRAVRIQPGDAQPDARGQERAAHDRRILGAQGAGPAPAPAALARQADGARARPRVRGVRPLDRRADLATSQDRGGGSGPSEAHPDRLGLRLRIRAGRPAGQVTLFARAFLLIALLIVAALLASLQIYRVYEREPRSRELAQQTVSTVNLTRAALVNADPVLRRQLLIELNKTEPLPDDELLDRVVQKVRDALGEETRFAYARDGEEGFWVSFFIDEDEFWVMLPRERFEPAIGLQWLSWLAAVVVLALLGAWFIASNIARPLAAMRRAAGRLGRGQPHQPLPEQGPREVRTVAAAFNRMASNLEAMERERAMVLAGISHDLRTPLSRLRLALEMSGAPGDEMQHARDAMVADIEEMDAIIGQFLDFARGENEEKKEHDIGDLVGELAEHY